MAVKGFGYIKYLDETNNVSRKVFSSNTNVNVGVQVIIEKINIQMTGDTDLPTITTDNINTYSVAAFAVGGDDSPSLNDDTSLHEMYVIRGASDDLSDPDSNVQFLAGTYDIDNAYDNPSGNITLVTKDNIDKTSNKDNDDGFRDNYYWKKIAKSEFNAPNTVKYTLNLSDKDVQDLTLSDVSDTNLTINEFGLYICNWDATNGKIVDNTSDDNYAKILLARLTDSYIKTQNSSIIIEWTVGVI